MVKYTLALSLWQETYFTDYKTKHDTAYKCISKYVILIASDSFKQDILDLKKIVMPVGYQIC